MPLTASRPTAIENCSPAAVRIAKNGNGRSVPPEVSSMGIESAAAGLANRARQRAANVAFSVVIKNVGAEQWFVGGIESEVLIVVPSFGSG
jgi:hypothetical protein